jgi:hypothetical protein
MLVTMQQAGIHHIVLPGVVEAPPGRDCYGMCVLHAQPCPGSCVLHAQLYPGNCVCAACAVLSR